MKFFRSERVSSLIKEELNKIILREIEFENAVVTILDVNVSRRLEEGVVKIAVYPSNKGPDALIELMRQRDKLQFLLMRKMNIKPMPRLIFQLEQGASLE